MRSIAHPAVVRNAVMKYICDTIGISMYLTMLVDVS